MPQQSVYGTTILEIHINPKRKRWNFRIIIGKWTSPQFVYGSTTFEIRKHPK